MPYRKRQPSTPLPLSHPALPTSPPGPSCCSSIGLRPGPGDGTDVTGARQAATHSSRARFWRPPTPRVRETLPPGTHAPPPAPLPPCTDGLATSCSFFLNHEQKHHEPFSSVRCKLNIHLQDAGPVRPSGRGQLQLPDLGLQGERRYRGRAAQGAVAAGPRGRRAGAMLCTVRVPLPGLRCPGGGGAYTKRRPEAACLRCCDL
jgi:hypothetical protein